MVDYVRLAATATRLLKANGSAVTLTKPRADDYDPALSSADDLPATSFNGFAINDPEGDYQQSFEEGTRKRADLYPLWVSMPDAAPEPGDSITWTGKDCSIVAVTPIAPGPVVVLYKVLARSP